MKNRRWQVLLSVGLVLLTAGLYGLHYFIFRDARHIFIYLLGDIAFLPVEVLFVTLIINRLLSRRDRRIKLNKLNMVIGTFFRRCSCGCRGTTTRSTPAGAACPS
jgi:di/tricarboxylate transporter